MKFNILALALAFSFPLITAAACAGCDTESLNAIGQCQTPWVDKVIACQNSPCNVKFAEDPILQCQGNIGDGTLNFTSTKTGYMTSDSSDGTLFPIPTIINDIDPSTSPNATGTHTATSIPTSTTTSTENSTNTSTNTSNSTNSLTSSSPSATGSSGAVPAFGGIGFGGGAAAMVGLAGLVGLVL